MRKEKRGHGSNGRVDWKRRERRRSFISFKRKGDSREEKWTFSFENCLRIELKSRRKREKKKEKKKTVDEKGRKEDGLRQEQK